MKDSVVEVATPHHVYPRPAMLQGVTVKSNTPFGRQATAWEIAYAVLFFLSEESVYITAQTLAVDAGLSGL